MLFKFRLHLGLSLEFGESFSYAVFVRSFTSFPLSSSIPISVARLVGEVFPVSAESISPRPLLGVGGQWPSHCYAGPLHERAPVRTNRHRLSSATSEHSTGSLNHPHRRCGVRILGLRNRLTADLAQRPNWEARARRFDGRSGI